MRTSRIARSKLRLLLALLLIVLPLGAAIWAVGDYAAGSERSQVDSRLSRQLTNALNEVNRIGKSLQTGASSLAGRRQVQAAMRSRDPAELARLRKENPTAEFVFDLEEFKEAEKRQAIIRSTEVTSGQGRLGWVVASQPLGDELRNTLAEAVGIDPERFAFVNEKLLGNDMNEPFELTRNGTRYRALAAKFLSGEQPVRLAVLTPASAVDAAARSMRLKVLLAGFLTIGSVLMIAYVFAPAIGRGRIAQQQRAIAGRVLSNVGDGIFLVDPEGAITFWNSAAVAITGLAESQVQGRQAQEAIPGWTAISPLVPVTESNALERAHAETLPLSLPQHDVWISISGVSFEEGTVYAFRDLTEERRLEEVRTDFVATVSHELRTPLASIHGAAATLQHHRESLSEPVRDQLLAVISEEAERLARLVEQILLASRLASGRLTIASEAFDAGALADEVVEAARLRISDAHTIELAVDPDLPQVSGNADHARQVLTNLVENAIKYSPDGGLVRVAVGVSEGKARFDVHDQGLGIPEKEQERVFEKFYRLDPQLKLGIGGSGLGLYISRELVQQMNGRLWVESSPGDGATFSFELPLAEAVVPAPVAAGS